MPEALLRDMAFQQRLQSEINAFPVMHKIVLQYYYYAGFGISEIAAKMGCSQEDVKAVLSCIRTKIKDIIGKGGEMITKIIQDASGVVSVNDVNAVKVDLEDDGKVIIYHNNKEIIEKTAKMIKDVIRVPEEGKIYKGKVVKIIDSGCFVEIWPGCDGMVHISELDTKRVDKVIDIANVGDDMIVKCLGYDKKGRLNLSRKAALK